MLAVNRGRYQSKNSKIVYLPGLNGLRAIAALAVVISHITISLDNFGLNSNIFSLDRDGHATGLLLAGYGVSIFFTLSGFLITFLLLKEKEISKFNVKNFYVRRILRIWPLYYLNLIVCIATALFFGKLINKASVPYYIFLAANIPYFTKATLPFLIHYWSLGVEEQFYLFFPQLAKCSNKKLLRISIALIFVLLALKFAFWRLYIKRGIELPFLAISTTRFHEMLFGVVAAILYYYRNKKFLDFATHKLTQIIAWGSIFLACINKFHISSTIDNELIAMVSIFLIIGQITKINNIINLENKFFNFIGKISYGMYVLHPVLIFYWGKLLGRFNNNAIQNYLLVYFLITACTVFLSYISYNYYESIFLKIKHRYTTVKSTDTNTTL